MRMAVVGLVVAVVVPLMRVPWRPPVGSGSRRGDGETRERRPTGAARMQTAGGVKVIARRRAKGRKRLSA